MHEARRPETTILKQILETGPSTESGIRFSVGMNYSQTKRYLELLVRNGYLAPQSNADDSTVFQVTEKGSRLLKLLSQVSYIIDPA